MGVEKSLGIRTHQFCSSPLIVENQPCIWVAAGTALVVTRVFVEAGSLEQVGISAGATQDFERDCHLGDTSTFVAVATSVQATYAQTHVFIASGCSFLDFVSLILAGTTRTSGH